MQPECDVSHDWQEVNLIGETTDFNLEYIESVGIDSTRLIPQRASCTIRGNMLIDFPATMNRHMWPIARRIRGHAARLRCMPDAFRKGEFIVHPTAINCSRYGKIRARKPLIVNHADHSARS